MALIVFSLVGCVANRPWRTQGSMICTTQSAECAQAVVEKYEKFDLAFVEFTDRGNLFSRSQLDQVLGHIKEAKDASGAGVAVIVFVHGWKHNAAYDDPNVKSFRNLLSVLAEQLTFGRRPIGVYVGWRGLSVDMWGVKDLTYWERKAVAQQVGKGGVTEVLLRLRQVVSPKRYSETHAASDRNLYLVIGHSFGGAIVLSALSEVLMDAMISAPESKASCVSQPCVEAMGFGHGVILLNPAIEATEGFQLKEASRMLNFPPSQIQLMHVISTDGDTATNTAFPLGQKLGLLSWKKTDLKRRYGGTDLTLAEEELDTTTIGNFTAFRTARLQGAPGEATGWRIFRCDESDHCQLNDAQWANHLGTIPNEPLSFVSTDASFIKDHNDIFNCNVIAYLAAVVEATRFKMKDTTYQGCVQNNKFDLLECFSAYYKRLERAAQFCPVQK